MIGRLLHLGTGGSVSTNSQPQATASRPVASLESVQEDTHTRNLLFPDPQTLFQSRNDQVFPLSGTPLTPPAGGATNTYDCNDDLDLDVRDVRVLVMQDTLGHANASLLYDSHPGPSVPANPDRMQGSGSDSRRTPASSRKGSIGQPSRPLSFQAGSPQGRQGAFDRRGSLHGRTPSASETEAQKAAREYRDELATFSSCIFGNSELMAYKGTSTKVHVVPESRTTEHPASHIGDGRTSLGRSSARSSKLSQSFTSYTASLNTATAVGSGPRVSDKKKVLITRLFPVSLTNEDGSINTTPQNRFSDDNTGYPFPVSNEEAQTTKKKTPPKQRRTPMYAVVLVVHLPSSRIPTGATPKSAFRESGSYTEQDVFSSSYSSAKPSWWHPSGEPTDSSFSVEVEDRIDSLTQHWDIVMRTLTHLQSVVATTIGTMLRQVDVASPDPYATPVPPNSFAAPRNQTLPDRRSGEFPRVKPPKSTIKLVSLWPNCLSGDVNVATEVNIARRRIVTGLKASRVVTGQGRWGIWRDEAIWTSKWSQDLHQGPFLCNLLTGFLATHVDWLQALSPPSLRKRFLNARPNRENEDLSLPARTVIVTEDKMAARRMVFLLSAFLPASQQLPASRPHRPSTSTSIGGFAQSPPTYVVPVLREESLRRKINRRSNRRTSHSRNTSQSARTGVAPAQLLQLGTERSHERRVSDAGSIRPPSIAMPGNDMVTRKSSTATTATILPETTTPHFSSVQRVDSNRRTRPESSGSVATDDLKRSLKRGESSGHMSSASTDSRSQGSRWGSVLTGLWSPRRRESTSMSSPGQPEDPKSPTKSSPVKRDKLSEMVREASMVESEQGGPSSRTHHSVARDVSTPREQTDRPRPSFSQADRTPDPTGAFDSPVKTSINEEDGVIDVDFPFPDYITSFESAISSPSSSGYLSTPGLGALDSFEHLARISLDGDSPLNAAGWLSSFHPDFCLQAIPPQDDLMEVIKSTLRSEPTPTHSFPTSRSKDSEHWVDVGRVVVADTTANTVRRIIHRRLVKPRQSADRPGESTSMSTNQTQRMPHTPSILPYEIQLEEEFVEELVYKPDEAILEAMEKVMKFRPENKDSPLARTTSRADSDSDHTLSDALQEATQLNDGSLEVPRVQCKTIVLSALEDIIRDAVDRRDKRSDNNDAGGRHQISLLQEGVQDWIASLDKGD